MKKLAVWLMLAVMIFAVISGGCGGGSDSSEPEQTENLTDDTGEYDPNEGGKGTSGTGEIDLSKLTANYTAKNGEILTGTLGANVKISIADGATVTLKDVTVNGEDSYRYAWAGLNCSGDAIFILEGTNSVKGFYDKWPGIHVKEHKTLTIKGKGELTASSNGRGAGIGGGWLIPCGNIVIEDGTITATGGDYAAGIGGGGYSRCGTITITGGTGTAKRGEVSSYETAFPDSIGAGLDGSCDTVTINEVEGAISAESGTWQTKITDLSTITANYEAQDREILTGTLGAKVKVSIADGATVVLRDVTINGEDSSSYDWPGLTCAGDATIFLRGDNNIKGFYSVNPGIYVPEGKTLTIKGDGSLTASSNGYAAGIGGGYYGYSYVSCGNIVIDGGTINATGGWGAAGIGSGYYYAKCSNVIINGGTVNAKGGYYAAGIGSGYDYSECEVTINGGTVNAKGGYYAAGIGNGYWCNGCNVTISDGTITAAGGEYGAAIGSGYRCNCGNITISGGTITAAGGYGAAGIGGGDRSKEGKVTISGGTITAIGGYDGAGIGSGYYADFGDITINGGTIEAIGDKDSAGIGSGYYQCTCGNITITDGTVTATGGQSGAGIGSGNKSECGDIVIKGGTVTATGGIYTAGIGSGGAGTSKCGNIIITNNVTKVTAIKGEGAVFSIEKYGDEETTTTINIGGQYTKNIEDSPYSYPPNK